MADLKNPVPGVRKPRQRRGRDVRLTEAQRQLLWDTLRQPQRFSFLYYISKLAALTAMRQGELREARWEAWEGRVLKLEDTKNGERRNIPLSKESVEVLTEWRSQQGHPEDGRMFPYSKDQVKGSYRLAVKAVRKANPSFPHVTFHDLRHIAATDLSKKLSNVLELSAVTGHKSVQVLKRYYNPDAEDLATKLG